MSVLETKQIEYSYSAPKKKVLNQVNLSFEQGKFYALMGQSGAGKSTLLSLLAGLDEPQKGSVLFQGTDIKESGYTKHRKEQISLIFQSYNLIDYLTPLENIRLVNPTASEQLLFSLGLSKEETRRNILKLSGGQQQRVAIARALAANTPVVLADEPTGNLDEDTALDIIEILKNLSHTEQKCVIMVTHSKELAALADEIIELKKGKAVVQKR